MSDPTPAPNACADCGIEARSHASRYTPAVGYHLYRAPSDEQRKQRIRAHRDEKNASTR